MKRNIRTDARTVQTDKIIKDTLIQMISEMDYNQITITELTKRANIHRKTFYLHYETIEALFDTLVNDIVEDMSNMMDGLFEDNPGLNLSKLGDGFTQLIKGNSDLHMKLFCNDSYGIVYNKIQERSCEHLLNNLKSALDFDPVTLENVVYFVSFGMNAVIRKSFIENRIEDKAALDRWAMTMTILLKMGNE